MSGNVLGELEKLALEAHADGIAAEARALAERAAEGRFYVACVGQFKRGKSTLLNALVGTDILPTGVIPVTSVPTVLRYSDLAARIRRAGGGWTEIEPASLPAFVSEEHNPGNRKGVLAVEAFVPSPLLASGLCFVDTPGLGSIFEANTATTREFVPQIDAALVVLGADPPISGEELALLKEIAREVDAFIFVLNKADRVSERERDEAAAFAQRVLPERLERPVERIFHVSALERLNGDGGTFDWDLLVEHLQRLAHDSGRSLVAQAARRGAVRLGARLQHALAEEIAALQRPLAESEQRLHALRAAADEAARTLLELGPLFSAEELRISQTFAARRKAFVQATVIEAEAALLSTVRASGTRSRPLLRRQAYELAQEVARQRVEPWLERSERLAGEAYRRAAARFTEMANGLLERLHASGAWAAEPLPSLVTPDEGLETRRRFYFHSFPHMAAPAGLAPTLRWIADLILPRGVVLRQIERGVQEFLHWLLEANASRVENDLKQRLHDSRRRLENEIRSLLAEAMATAERAMERARAVQAEGQEAVRTSVARLEGLQARLAALLAPDGTHSLGDGRVSLRPEEPPHGETRDAETRSVR
jgi:dynamin family protein